MQSITHITPKNIQVLRMVAEGLGNKEIASRLHVSEQTVKNHLSDILFRLDANDRTHAVVIAHRKGLLPLGCYSEL